MSYFLILLSALAIAMASVPPLIWVAQRRALFDMPDERKVHTHAVPRLGGLAIALGVFVPVLLWLPISVEYLAYLVGLSIILVFGLIDDVMGLGYRWKFLGQFIAVLIVIIGGGVMVTQLPFMGVETLSAAWAIPFTVIAMIGVTNAINLADGLDGLAGGQVLLSLAAVAMLAFLAGGHALIILSLALAGAILGFLRYNTYPAKIFMGDAGSQFLGFSLGFLVIVLSQQIHTSMSPVAVLFLLGVPILDTLTVMMQRLFEHRPLFMADRNHIHHKLLELGLDHYEAVSIIYCAQALLVGLGYALRYASDGLLMAIYLVLAVLMIGSFRLARLRGWRLAGAHPLRESFLKRQVATLRRTGIVLRITLHAIRLLVSLLFLVIVLGVDTIPIDIAQASLALALISAVIQIARPSWQFVLQISIYITAVFMIYLLEFEGEGVMSIVNILIVALSVFVILGIRLTRGNDFRITPMDVLIIFIAIVGPYMADFRNIDESLANGIPKVIVIFYALEFVLHREGTRRQVLQWFTLLTLLLAGVRGLIMP